MILGNDENEKGRRERGTSIGIEIVSAIVIETGTRTVIESDGGTTTTDHIGATTTTTSHRGDMTRMINTSHLREDMTTTIGQVAISLPEIIQMTGSVTEAETETGIEIETGIGTGIPSETATKTATEAMKETARGIGIKSSNITQPITHHLTTQRLANARTIHWVPVIH